MSDHFTDPGSSDMTAVPNASVTAAPSWLGLVSTTAGGGASGGSITVTGGSSNCYPIQPWIQPTVPQTYVYPVAYPVMHPHCCPVCEGKETVPAGFYRDTAEDKGPQQCRACKGKGVLYSP